MALAWSMTSKQAGDQSRALVRAKSSHSVEQIMVLLVHDLPMSRQQSCPERKAHLYDWQRMCEKPSI